jgi:peptide deformylase
MILPIVAYGDPVLRKECTDITLDYPNLDTLLENMFETMYAASGIGLAAPQIGLAIRLFLVDASPFADDEDMTEEEQAEVSDFKKIFINATVLKEEGDEWVFQTCAKMSLERQQFR